MPDSTAAPLAAWTELTTPSRGHMISFSIFMASRTMRTSPFLTLWPGVTLTARMVPGMGEVILSPSPAEVAEVFSVPLSFFRRQQPEVYRYELVPTRPDQFPYGAVGIPETYRWARGTVEVPVWFWEGHPIWGMTARIVRDLIKE